MLQPSIEKDAWLNPEKVTIGASEDSDFGHHLSAEGIMANYLANFAIWD